MSIPSTFKAAILEDKASRHVISERSLAALDPNEIFLATFPAVLGSDAAGEIVAVGPNISTFTVGDRVFFQGIIGTYAASTFQQYCKMPAALVARTPSSITDDQAAGLSLATIAAATGLYDKTGSGKAIVVLGGSSSVGQYVIQLARLSGFSRIVTGASARHQAHLESLGAHVVLDRNRSRTGGYVASLSGVSLDFVFDSISLRETQVLGVQILRAAGSEGCGRVVTVLGADPEAQALGAKEPKVEVRQVMGIGSLPALRYLSESLFRHLGGDDGWLARGLYVPNHPVVVEGGLEKVDEALDKNRAGVSGVNVVIRP